MILNIALHVFVMNLALQHLKLAWDFEPREGSCLCDREMHDDEEDTRDTLSWFNDFEKMLLFRHKVVNNIPTSQYR